MSNKNGSNFLVIKYDVHKSSYEYEVRKFEYIATSYSELEEHNYSYDKEDNKESSEDKETDTQDDEYQGFAFH